MGIIPIKPETQLICGEGANQPRILILKAAASALAEKGLSTVGVVSLFTAALSEIEEPPSDGEALVVVVAGTALTFEFTPTGMIVGKLTD